MKKLDEKTVDKIAALAKLSLDKEEKKEIKKDLEEILGFIDKLEEIDTEKVEPLEYMLGEEFTLREDEAAQNITQQEALKNAQSKDSDYFKVPTVLKK